MNGATQTDTRPPRPKALSVMAENIPADLKRLNQWVVWRYELNKDNEWTKVPCQINGRNASTTDPTTWTDFPRALAAYQLGRVKFDGIGLACTVESGIVGVDLDHCVDRIAHKWEPWAIEIIRTLDSYAEFSPSGSGVRVWVKGSLPDGRRKKGNVEMYVSGRYLTLTGHILKNLPRTIEQRQDKIAEVHEKFLADKPEAKPKPNNGAWYPSDDQLLDKAFAAKNGDKLKALFDGDTSGHDGDDSAADLALCSMLAFWAADDGQLDRLFRRSGLMRDKWDEKHGAVTYGELTIGKAFTTRTERYEPGQTNSGRANSYNSSNSYKQSERAKPEVSPDVFQGLAGEIVKAIEPYTESDPVATLANVLTMFGNVLGHNPWFGVERTRHYLNLFFVEVGETSKGRKGTSLSTPRSMMADIDDVWAATRVTGGLSSGEGLIYQIRDERFESKAFREDGEITYKTIRVDEGAPDKRLMLVEEELSQGLKTMSREGNTLSAIIRQAWDSGNLHPLTKNSPIRATDAHISIIGHITREELLRYLTETEQANGFANRFVWLMVYRSKKISNPKGVPNEILNPLTGKLGERIDAARKVGEMVRTEKAEETWSGVYPELTEGKPGLIGAVLARGEPQVMRLACVYALMDGKAMVDVPHLNAALALWDYSEQSAMTIFGDLIGDPNVDAAQEGLKAKGTLTLTELHALFGRNVSATEVDRVVAVLLKRGLISVETVTDDRGRKSITMLRWGTNSTNSTNSRG